METFYKTGKIQITPAGNGKYILYDRRSDASYEIGEREQQVLCKLDGKTSIDDLAQSCTYYTKEELQALIGAFSDIGILEGTGKKRKIRPFKMKLMLFSPNECIPENSIAVKAFRFLLVYAAIPLFLLSTALFIWFGRDIVSIAKIFSEQSSYISPMTYIALSGGMLLCLLGHEMSHAVVARSYHISVAEIGFMLYLFIPVAYTNMNGLDTSNDKKGKVLALSAGNLFNLLLCSLCEVAMVVLHSDYAFFLTALVAISNMMIIAINSLVFVKYDAYYILETLLDEPGLMQKAIFRVGTVLQGLTHNNRTDGVRGKHTTGDGMGREGFYFLYGLFSMVFMPMIAMFLLRMSIG